MFFKDSNGKGFEVMSEALSVRSPDGEDYIMVVTKRLYDNKVHIIHVGDIDTIETEKSAIGH